MLNSLDELFESIFRKNDIRGRVPEELNFDVVEKIGKAFASYIQTYSNKKIEEIWISIGYDARLHSPQLCKGLIQGITSLGANVVDLGMCPTPVVYYSSFYKVNDYNIPDGSIMITGSHNPPNYNGLKMCKGIDCLQSIDIQEIKNIILANHLVNARVKGDVVSFNILTPYMNELTASFKDALNNTSIKVVIDSGNGCAGEVVPQILRNIGCEVIELYSLPDGTFPNHHPDPTVINNLKDLIDMVKLEKADVGIAFDGDVDRIGVIDDQGNVIPGDLLMLIFGLEIIASGKYDKPTFISEVKSSQVLYDVLNAKGANTIMWKTGHSFIKDKMKKEKALLAGEMSGHIFFADRYYGFDDAIYAACRLIEIIARKKKLDPGFSTSKYLDQYPKMYSTPEIRKRCNDQTKFDIVERLKLKLLKLKETDSNIRDVITIDGVRIVFSNGFGLVRASNTEPILVLRFEDSSQEKMLQHQNFVEGLLAEEMD